MAFIAHYRGRFREYDGEFNESMLFQQVTLDEFLNERYPSFLMENYPEQARADREKEERELQAVLLPADTLWLWHLVDPSQRTDGSASEWGGLAVKRGGKIIRVWLVWQEH